jgi:hypothetical protein
MLEIGSPTTGVARLTISPFIAHVKGGLSCRINAHYLVLIADVLLSSHQINADIQSLFGTGCHIMLTFEEVLDKLF